MGGFDQLSNDMAMLEPNVSICADCAVCVNCPLFGGCTFVILFFFKEFYACIHPDFPVKSKIMLAENH